MFVRGFTNARERASFARRLPMVVWVLLGCSRCGTQVTECVGVPRRAAGFDTDSRNGDIMKMLKHWILATLSVGAVTACGVTDPPIDNETHSTIWQGRPKATTQVSTGGYWWTYTDHAAYDITHGAAQYEQGATIYPQTNQTTPLKLEIDANAPARGQIVHARGSVPPAPNYTSLIVTAQYSDLYWQSVYADSLLQDYPLAGVGFGYQPYNAPFDIVQGRYVGFVFDMKTEAGTNDIAVAVPTAVTDMPDPNNNDKWAKQCTYPSQQPGQSNASSYQGTSANQTCFADYQKIFYMIAQDGGFSGDTRAADGVWQTYCVLWSELILPSWVKPGANLPAAMTAGMLAQTLKTKWDFFQPPDGGSSASFDIRLDNFKMVTATEAIADGTVCNSANVEASAAIANVPKN